MCLLMILESCCPDYFGFIITLNIEKSPVIFVLFGRVLAGFCLFFIFCYFNFLHKLMQILGSASTLL